MVYRFGEFSLDTENIEFKQNDKQLDIEPQVFSLLCCLIENRCRVVSKDEMIETVWGGRIITDTALNTRINAVRKAVGDDGKTQAVIKTYRKRGFRFIADVSDSNPTEKQSLNFTQNSDKNSIAVLPFKNLSDDPEQEYFADGITEDLITGLSKLSGLTVIGRNSSFFYKEKVVNLGIVGQELDVKFVLEGSVRKADERVRITAQLTDLGSSCLVWADSHDGMLGDVFDLQDEITGRILSALSVQLVPGETNRLINKYTDSSEAHDWFMRGRIRYREPGPQANAEAQIFFDNALAADPHFAYAIAVRSYLKFHAWFFKWNLKTDALIEALDEAELAARLDPNLAAAHGFLGWMHMWGDGMERALAEHAKALSLDPNHADGHLWQASTLIYCGTPELAIDPMDRAMRLEPHAPPIYLLNYGHLLLQLDRYDEAVNYLQAAIKIAPQFPMNYIFLAIAKAAQGNHPAAEEAGSELLARLPAATVSSLGAQMPYAKEADRAKVIDRLRLAGLPE